MSLYLGKEIFDVESQKVMDHNHLFIRQGAGLQAQSVFTDKLVFRPHSTETLTHRKVTLNMADKSNKAQKVKVMTDVTDNPETRKMVVIFVFLWVCVWGGRGWFILFRPYTTICKYLRFEWRAVAVL